MKHVRVFSKVSVLVGLWVLGIRLDFMVCEKKFGTVKL